jgi:hypothetical protein
MRITGGLVNVTVVAMPTCRGTKSGNEGHLDRTLFARLVRCNCCSNCHLFFDDDQILKYKISPVPKSAGNSVQAIFANYYYVNYKSFFFIGTEIFWLHKDNYSITS